MNYRFFLPIITFLVFSVTLTSCELAGDIFEAGMWTGVIGIVLAIVLIVGGISWLFGRGRRSH